MTRSNIDNFLTPEAAALELEVSLSRIHQLLRAGRLGSKIGGRYLIERSELEAFSRIPRPVGNPNFIKKMEIKNDSDK